MEKRSVVSWTGRQRFWFPEMGYEATKYHLCVVLLLIWHISYD